MKIADLHIHTVYSDGVLDIEGVLEKVLEADLSGFSITDHDSFDGIPSALEWRRKKAPDLFFWAGCEFSAFNDDIGEIHILGYFNDNSYRGMLPLAQSFRDSRVRRALTILDCLKKEGYFLDPEILIHDNKKGAVGRMHIARELVRKGYFHDTAEAFDKVLKNGASCYVPRKEISTEGIIREIKNNNGKSVIAHPNFLNRMKNWNILDLLIKNGLDGLEYKHPKISTELSRKIEEFMPGKLLLTGGSDFHGDNPNDKIGRNGVVVSQLIKFLSNFTER